MIKFIRKLLVFEQSYIFWVDNIFEKFKFLQKELKTWILKKNILYKSMDNSSHQLLIYA